MGRVAVARIQQKRLKMNTKSISKEQLELSNNKLIRYLSGALYLCMAVFFCTPYGAEFIYKFVHIFFNGQLNLASENTVTFASIIFLYIAGFTFSAWGILTGKNVL